MGHTLCLAHLSPADRAAYLNILAPGAGVDHRGTTFDGPLLAEVLDALRDPSTTRPRLGTAFFSAARFVADARFHDTTFTAEARFDGATFTGDAGFDGATFNDQARYDRATFTADAGFTNVRFLAEARFAGAMFAANALFDHTHFTVAWFSGATFAGTAWFNDTTFTAFGRFGRATFSASTRFDRATFADTAGFTDAAFASATNLGPLTCGGEVDLSGAVFGAPIVIEIEAARLSCLRTRWDVTAALRLRHAALDLSDAVVTQPLAVTSHPTPFASATAPISTPSPPAGPVRVESLRGVDAAHVVLTDTDLTGCVFTGAFHLDQLALAGETVFAVPPTGWRLRNGVPARLARRRTVAEEHHSRALAPGEPPAPTGLDSRPRPPAHPAHPRPRGRRSGLPGTAQSLRGRQERTRRRRLLLRR
ncbi:pentapeptide repeat-containing protein, partial [Streptomyces sp. SID3343]|uniref:pentapeptide repeat-containing protein n=1 Tax=Streptomyces sp. SID3343 TaxID=2690260 RepID=UPI00136F964A